MKVRLIEGSLLINDLKTLLKELSLIAYENDVILQGINADRIAGRDHICYAISKAREAMENGKNIAKDLSVEILRYASGKRQINEAFSMGLYEGEVNAVFIVLGRADSMDTVSKSISCYLKPAKVMDYSPSKNEALISQFDITSDELKAVGEDKIPELVRERVALVNILK